MIFSVDVQLMSIVWSMALFLHLFKHMKSVLTVPCVSAVPTPVVVGIVVHLILGPVDWTQPLIAQFLYKFLFALAYRYLLQHVRAKHDGANLLLAAIVGELVLCAFR